MSNIEQNKDQPRYEGIDIQESEKAVQNYNSAFINYFISRLDKPISQEAMDTVINSYRGYGVHHSLHLEGEDLGQADYTVASKDFRGFLESILGRRQYTIDQLKFFSKIVVVNIIFSQVTGTPYRDMFDPEGEGLITPLATTTIHIKVSNSRNFDVHIPIDFQSLLNNDPSQEPGVYPLNTLDSLSDILKYLSTTNPHGFYDPKINLITDQEYKSVVTNFR